MASKRVIVYCVGESERKAAEEALTDPSVTDSYVIGEIDDDDITGLRDRGMIVDDLAALVPATPLRASRYSVRALGRPSASSRGGGAAATSHRPGHLGIEAMTASSGAAPPPPPAHEDPVTTWSVVMTGPLEEHMRERCDEIGIVLDERVSPFEYRASATHAQADALIAEPFVVDVTVPDETASAFDTTGIEARGRGARPATARWDLWLDSDRSAATLTPWLEASGAQVVGGGGRKLRVDLPAGRAWDRDLADRPEVKFAAPYVAPKLFNEVARGLLGVQSPKAGPLLDLDGAGQVVAVADTGLDTNHPDFAGRVAAVVALGPRGETSDPVGHGTHVAGSILGDGAASNGTYAGVAPKAQLYFQSILGPDGDLGGLPPSLADLFEPAYQAGARIHSNSWGADTASAYTVDSIEVDTYIAERPDMLVVIAAGNEGTAQSHHHAKPGFVDWLSIGSPASCKNALTVGASRSSRAKGGMAERTYGEMWKTSFPDPPVSLEHVSGDPDRLAAFSSRGPCDDYRIKPDVVAPGTDIISTRSADAPTEEFWALLTDNTHYGYMGGTSMATPLVAGCAALVRQYYVRDRKVDPSAALVKATIINGTRWLDGDDAIADPGVPNVHQGFGAVDLSAALPNPLRPGLALEFVDTWKAPNLQLAATGSKVGFKLDAESDQPLRVCLAYTDLPGRGLQNDVSLLVRGPDGRQIAGNDGLPGALTSSDTNNNVERIHIEKPQAGKYHVQVFARNLLQKNQGFALVVTGHLNGGLAREVL